MSNQNRTTIDKLNLDINELKIELENQKQSVLEKENQILRLNDNHQKQLIKKDEEIHALKRKIDDMSNEFAEMLKVKSNFLLINRKHLKRCSKELKFLNGTHKLIRENIREALSYEVDLYYQHQQLQK